MPKLLIPFLNVFILFALSNISCYGQIIDWSNTQKLRGNSIFTTVIGEDESGVYVMRHRNKLLSRFIVLERYRHNLGLENSKSFLLKNTRVLYADITEKGLLLIKQVFDKKENKFTISAVYLNSSFEISQPEATLMTYYNIDWGVQPDIIIKPTPDHKHYLIFCFEMSSSKNCFYKFTSFDTNLKVIKTEEYKFNPKTAIDRVLGLETQNNQNYFFLAIQKRNKRGEDIFCLLDHEQDSNRLLILEDSIREMDKPMLYYNSMTGFKGITGFYSSRKSMGYDGNFIMKWQTIENISITWNTFSSNIIRDLEGEAMAQNAYLPYSYKPLKIIGRSDGGFIKISENVYVQKDEEILIINGVSSAQGKNIYTFGNILLQNYDSSGKLVWENSLTKNQTTVNDGGMLGSASIAVSNTKLNIIFNDPLASGGDILMASFSTDGTKDIKIIARGDEMNAFIIPLEGKQISRDKIVIPVLKDRKFALVKITYQ